MVEGSPEDIEPPQDSSRAKRPPPTIDLEATDLSGKPAESGADEPKQSSPWFRRAATSSAIIAAISGACAGALVIGIMWLSGWPGAVTPQTAPAAPPVEAAAIDDLAKRVAQIESRNNKSVAPASDPAIAAKLDALDKAVGTMREEIAGLRAQSQNLAAAVNDFKSPDVADINQRIAALERATRAQGAEAAQESGKAADDVPLRRMVTAALLESLVRTGEPYPAALATAKSLAPNPDALKPLEGFATSGVPSPAVLCRELLALIPKMSPHAPEKSAGASSLIERLEAGAAKLVRIERTDAVGSQPGNVVARVTAAALRNDYNEARRELNTLPAADRAPAQGWIEKADARDAALAASRQFAAEAMTTLAKPAQ